MPALRNAAAGFAILALGESIREVAYRATEPAGLASVAFFNGALRILFLLSVHGLLFDALPAGR